jgi:hypothetical protein
MKRTASIGTLLLVSGIAHAQEQGKPPPTEADERVAAMLAEMPHVRVDRHAHTVEFDGYVPINAHIAEAPNLYLEVMVCTPDVRAHESLVASRASPSHVHAALLLIGLTPGKTGSWKWDGERAERIAPEGSPVEVWFVWTDERGEQRADLASDWVISRTDGRRLTETIPENEPRWVFAGSRMVSRGGREWYAAEAEGTIVGLHTFTTETIAWRGVMSPSVEVEDPEWIADPERVPKQGTEVVVRIKAIERAKPEAAE